jgi:hypothetical protein
MSSVRISLIGTIGGTHPPLTTEIGTSRAVKALLGYLTCFQQQVYAREVLTGRFR